MTHQESDSLVFAFCALSGSTTPNGGTGRTARSRTGIPSTPATRMAGSDRIISTTAVTPVPSRVTSTTLGNGLNLSSANAPLDLWTVYNNIHHGVSNEDGAALADWDHNINTKGSGTGSGTRGAERRRGGRGSPLHRSRRRRFRLPCGSRRSGPSRRRTGPASSPGSGRAGRRFRRRLSRGTWRGPRSTGPVLRSARPSIPTPITGRRPVKDGPVAPPPPPSGGPVGPWCARASCGCRSRRPDGTTDGKRLCQARSCLLLSSTMDLMMAIDGGD